jgi:hypothetical protein
MQTTSLPSFLELPENFQELLKRNLVSLSNQTKELLIDTDKFN